MFNYISKLKKTTVGPDGLPYWLFRENAHSQAEPLTHMFNLSLSSSVFPETWKIGCIKPIPKCPRPSKFSDLRPICLTPIIARVFERIVFDSFVSERYHSTLSNNQFGFRKGSSITCALIKLLNDVYYIRSENDYVRIITLDLSKAFDSISHRAIIDGLRKSHYNPFLINWFNSFLSRRVYSTLVNDQLSRELTTSQGVPQGTVNGPPLFNSGTSDISVTTDIPERRCRLTKFADDFTPVVGGRIGEHYYASDVINALEVQFNSKNLTLNDGKTKEVLLSFKKGQQPRTIPGVERVMSRQKLGVIFDENLSFMEHITAICKASVLCLYLLLRLKHLNYTAEELNLLYNSLVISRLSYCASVWGGTYSYLLDQIDRVQNKARFFGIIDEIEPIREIIRKSDQALLRKITETGYLHQLYHLLPRRTDYAADTLRPRNAGVMKTKLEKQLCIFPLRVLRGVYT